MTEDLDEFLEIQLDVSFQCTSKVAPSPATASTMGHGSANAASGREEEEVNVRIHLADNAEVDVEMQV